MTYWLHVDGVIHKSECGFCNNGGQDAQDMNPDNWHGPYATRGAALDATLALGVQPRQPMCCWPEEERALVGTA